MLRGPELAAPGVAAPGVAAPGVAAPELAAPGVAAPELPGPKLVDPELADPGLSAPELAGPVPEPLPDEVVAGELALVPFDAAELDAGELGVEGGALADVDADPVTLGLAVLVGAGEDLVQGVPVVLADFALRGALTLEVADAFVPALLVAALLAAALLAGVLDAPAVVGGVLVALALSPELALSLAGLLLVPPLARLDTGGAGGTLGVTDLPAVAGDAAEGHVVAVPPGWAMALLAWPMPPFDEPSRVPVPGWVCGAAVLGEVIPTC